LLCAYVQHFAVFGVGFRQLCRKFGFAIAAAAIHQPDCAPLGLPKSLLPYTRKRHEFEFFAQKTLYSNGLLHLILGFDWERSLQAAPIWEMVL
jgi:hypothetical protein